MSVALDNGLEVTALHNHFFWDTPEGDVHAHRRHGRRARSSPARSARCSRDSRRRAGGKGEVPARRHRPREDDAVARRRSRRSSAHKGELKDGVYKVVIGRTTKMDGHDGRQHDGRQHLGGVRRQRRQGGRRRRLRDAGIRAAAGAEGAARRRHRHRGDPQPHDRREPRIMFLHYWGVGPTEDARHGRSRPRSTRPNTRRPRREQRRSQRAGRSPPAREPGRLAGRAAVLPAPGHVRLRRPDRARRLHAARPGREARLDLEEGLRRRAGAGAARARPARRAARHLPRLGEGPRVRRHRGRGRLHPAVVRDGPGALGALRALRRAALDAERVLRHRRGGHRHHRAQRAQAREDDARQGPPAVGAVRGQRRRHGLDGVRDHLVVRGVAAWSRWSCRTRWRPRRPARRAVSARPADHGRRRRDHGRGGELAAAGQDRALLRGGGRLRVRQRAGDRPVPARRRRQPVPLADASASSSTRSRSR